ncbi:hypothetical protein HDU89_008153 [Geranomyces variabilis]|nr:hypothetical protein HDU89_008153 [Geranomyces variabilis]
MFNNSRFKRFSSGFVTLENGASWMEDIGLGRERRGYYETDSPPADWAPSTNSLPAGYQLNSTHYIKSTTWSGKEGAALFENTSRDFSNGGLCGTALFSTAQMWVAQTAHTQGPSSNGFDLQGFPSDLISATQVGSLGNYKVKEDRTRKVERATFGLFLQSRDEDPKATAKLFQKPLTNPEWKAHIAQGTVQLEFRAARETTRLHCAPNVRVHGNPHRGSYRITRDLEREARRDWKDTAIPPTERDWDEMTEEKWASSHWLRSMRTGHDTTHYAEERRYFLRRSVHEYDVKEAVLDRVTSSSEGHVPLNEPTNRREANGPKVRVHMEEGLLMDSTTRTIFGGEGAEDTVHKSSSLSQPASRAIESGATAATHAVLEAVVRYSRGETGSLLTETGDIAATTVGACAEGFFYPGRVRCDTSRDGISVAIGSKVARDTFEQKKNARAVATTAGFSGVRSLGSAATNTAGVRAALGKFAPAAVGAMIDSAECAVAHWQAKQSAGRSKVCLDLARTFTNSLLSQSATSAVRSAAFTFLENYLASCAIGGSAVTLGASMASVALPAVVAGIAGWGVTKVCNAAWTAAASRISVHQLQDQLKQVAIALSINPNVPLSEARTAFRQAALRCHPDKAGGSADDFNALTLMFERFVELRSELATGQAHREALALKPGTTFNITKEWLDSTFTGLLYYLRNFAYVKTREDRAAITGDAVLGVILITSGEKDGTEGEKKSRTKEANEPKSDQRGAAEGSKGAQPKPEPQPQPHPLPEPQPELQAEPLAQKQPETQPEPLPEKQPEMQPETQPGTVFTGRNKMRNQREVRAQEDGTERKANRMQRKRQKPKSQPETQSETQQVKQPETQTTQSTGKSKRRKQQNISVQKHEAEPKANQTKRQRQKPELQLETRPETRSAEKNNERNQRNIRTQKDETEPKANGTKRERKKPELELCNPDLETYFSEFCSKPILQDPFPDFFPTPPGSPESEAETRPRWNGYPDVDVNEPFWSKFIPQDHFPHFFPMPPGAPESEAETRPRWNSYPDVKLFPRTTAGILGRVGLAFSSMIPTFNFW